MTRQILLLVCLGLIRPCTFLKAQSDNEQKFSVSGTVINSASSEPVRGALVEIVDSTRKSAIAGADGHFQIDGISGGSAAISARRPGFDPNQRPQAIKIDSNLEGITVKLMPLSRISGRVLDSEGEPVEGAVITGVVQQISNGRRQWQHSQASATTDESGNYLIEDLNPGTYILSTHQKQLYFTQPKSEAARYVYPPTFYPDSSSRDLAQQITLAPGTEMRADITLHAVRGIRITVNTVPALSNIIASIVQGEDQLGSNGALAGQQGELEFPAVSPGTWKIIASGPFNPRPGEPNAEPLYGEVQVDAGSVDIHNLKLPMNKLADIPVTVSGPDASNVFLQLFSKTGMMVNGSNPEPGGELKIRQVQPGTYRVAARFNGGDSCVTSMMSASQDLLHDELVVGAGSSVAPIQVTESNNCAQLTVSTNTKDKSVVVITSGNIGFEPRLLPNGGQSVSTYKGFAAGDYKVYAFDDVTDLEYANPEALREFKSQSVHLEAGQKATVQLELNQRLAR